MPTVNWNKRWGNNLLKYLKNQPKGEKSYGDRWGDPNKVEILKKIRDEFVIPFVDENKTALEIGSGGGRWTQFLLKFGRLYVTDLNQQFFHYILDRFGPRPNISFSQSTGTDFPGIPKKSVDFVFSFGTFVHIDTDTIKEILKSIKTITKDNADIVIHYSEKNKPGGAKREKFSNNTREIMTKLVEEEGFSVVSEDIDTLPNGNVIHFRPS